MKQEQAVAYYRVSTAKQGRSGLGLEAQEEAVRSYVVANDKQLLAYYRDIESGKNDDRPQLQRALEHCRMTGARLVIAKLDRLSRDLAFIAQLRKSGVKFTATDMPEANELTINIMAAVAQEERRAISERTKAALAAAKARGVKLGNPANLSNQKTGSERGNSRKTALADEHARLAMNWISDARKAGAASLRDVAEALNAQGLRTPKGALWTAVQVKRAGERAGRGQG